MIARLTRESDDGFGGGSSISTRRASFSGTQLIVAGRLVATWIVDRARLNGLTVAVRLVSLGFGEARAMLEDQFIELIDPLLRAGGSVLEDGRRVS